MTVSVKTLEDENREIKDKVEALQKELDKQKVVYTCTNGHPFKRMN